MTGKDAEPVRTYPAGPAEIEIDATGLVCPLPVLRLAKALRMATPGTRVRLIATDPASQVDVPHFCAQSGHALVESGGGEGGFWYVVACRAP